jgi:hypothetical protein
MTPFIRGRITLVTDHQCITRLSVYYCGSVQVTSVASCYIYLPPTAYVHLTFSFSHPQIISHTLPNAQQTKRVVILRSVASDLSTKADIRLADTQLATGREIDMTQRTAFFFCEYNMKLTDSVFGCWWWSVPRMRGTIYYRLAMTCGSALWLKSVVSWVITRHDAV